MESWRGRWMFIALEGSLIGAAILLGWLLGQPPLARCAWSTAALSWGLVATLPMLAALGLCLAWPDGPWRSLVGLVDDLLIPVFRTWNWGELALAAALAGVGEEMLFRGVIQDAIQQATSSVPTAILMTSLLFGLVHVVTLSYAIFATLVGIYLGWLFVAVGDLTAPIVAHAVYDFIALVYLAKIRQPRGKEEQPQSKTPEHEVDV